MPRYLTILLALSALPQVANAHPGHSNYRVTKITPDSYSHVEVRHHHRHRHAARAPRLAVRRFSPPPRWSIGVHGTGMASTIEMGESGTFLGGVGGHLRYRGYRWGVEFSADLLGTRFGKDTVTRISAPLQASALLYIVPRGRLNVFLLAGVRLVPTFMDYDLPGLKAEQVFLEYGLHTGIGGELVITRHFSLTGDARVFGVMRYNGEESDGMLYGDISPALVPDKSLGLQVNLGASFRF
jgi:hypothetical protein